MKNYSTFALVSVAFLSLVLSSNSFASENAEATPQSTAQDAKSKKDQEDAIFLERAELVSKTQHIVSTADTFVKDDDTNTVQIVMAAKDDKTVSNVSEDGQVIFLNAATKTDVPALMDESIDKRLALK